MPLCAACDGAAPRATGESSAGREATPKDTAADLIRELCIVIERLAPGVKTWTEPAWLNHWNSTMYEAERYLAQHGAPTPPPHG